MKELERESAYMPLREVGQVRSAMRRPGRRSVASSATPSAVRKPAQMAGDRMPVGSVGILAVEGGVVLQGNLRI
jgi:hypothetical protein